MSYRAKVDLIAAKEEIARLRAALDNVEAVMSIVAPRSDTKEYLACLAQVRAALRPPAQGQSE